VLSQNLGGRFRTRRSDFLSREGGLKAATFAGRYGLGVGVVEQLGAGGQIATAESIENFPGFPGGIGGHELGPLLQEQAEAAGDIRKNRRPARGSGGRANDVSLATLSVGTLRYHR